MRESPAAAWLIDRGCKTCLSFQRYKSTLFGREFTIYFCTLVAGFTSSPSILRIGLLTGYIESIFFVCCGKLLIHMPPLRYLLLAVFIVCFVWFLIALIRLRPVFRRRCPGCKAERGLVREARPAFIKSFLPFLPIKAYHCRSCMQNFVLIDSRKSDTPIA